MYLRCMRPELEWTVDRLHTKWMRTRDWPFCLTFHVCRQVLIKVQQARKLVSPSSCWKLIVAEAEWALRCSHYHTTLTDSTTEQIKLLDVTPAVYIPVQFGTEHSTTFEAREISW